MNKKLRAIGKTLMTILLVLIAAASVRFGYLGSQSAKMKVSLGIANNKLVDCPDKPNCIVSFSKDERHAMDAILIKQNPIKALEEILENQDMKIIEVKDNYIKATHSSTVFGFVDDIEFLYLESVKQLHFRSASRVGYSDLGANRKRMKKVLHLLQKKFPKYR
jgi:uncharacterized protein (DUF1499 family)